MTAISLMAECKKALPDAQVFVLIDGRYKRVEKVLLSGVDPVVMGLTSVCLDGEEYVSVKSVAQGMFSSMTLRDKFAAEALGLLSARFHEIAKASIERNMTLAAAFAEASFEIADAMLAKREEEV